jgi:hypothetical protein
LCEDLSIGCLVGGLLELASQEQRLLNNERFERRLGLERARHGGTSGYRHTTRNPLTHHNQLLHP